ncbi:fungal specific transcription factor domain-containing protein 35 [Elsinoe australis]|uniref:Fungal specific transcription factor domain-containing protein 35 n=1 Tax=Elsinoe australis TaxID=40998 RepID=A0A4U7B6B7_9PEZI|nr:fungal specific transcription factor domain-containing protein 35 [Elsinoe australis]
MAGGFVHGSTDIGPFQGGAMFGTRRRSSTVPGSAAPGSSAPGNSVPGSTAPGSSVPGSVAPGSSVPGSVAPGSSIPDGSVPGSSERMEATYTDIGWLPQTDTTRGPSSCLMRVGTRASGLRHLDLLSDPGLQSEIIEHWTQSLCDSFNPVPGMNNPMRCTFTPIALEGAQSDCTVSSGSVALFHLICAASAFSLSRMRALPDAKRALERMALEHHNHGITHMRQNIQSNDESQCVSILASLVMCLYNDAITGPTPYWRLHMRGAVKWVNHFDYQVWQQSESASLIYQMFNCMATYIQSQFLLVDHDESLWDLPFDSPGPYMLDLAFGLPLSLLRGLSSINQIHMARIRSNRGYTDDAMQTSIPNVDRLELELYMSMPTKLHSSDKVLDEMVYHNGYIHYYANLIYMKRVLKDASIEGVQSLIEQALDHIEALQTTTSKTFSPFLWPISIIALDAYHTTLQRRSSRCLDTFARRSGLDMWNQLSQLIKELWALRETQGNANMKWHESSLFFANHTFMML